MDGKALAAEIKSRLAQETQMMKAAGVQPKLATILVGDDAPSRVYVAGKHRAAQELGIKVEGFHLPGMSPARDLELLNTQAQRGQVGQRDNPRAPTPLAPRREEDDRADRAEKDVDGLTTVNMGQALLQPGRPGPLHPQGDNGAPPPLQGPPRGVEVRDNQPERPRREAADAPSARRGRHGDGLPLKVQGPALPDEAGRRPRDRRGAPPRLHPRPGTWSRTARSSSTSR